MPLPIGEIVGDYEVIGVLGHGGMGTVYRVRNVISDRVEAMKVLLPSLVDQPGLADRFLREIKVLAKLEHPNITALRTAFRAKDQLWMVMELVEGASLETVLRERRLSVEESLRYTAQALDALAYAHQMGVVHRDLKPGNMILAAAGVVKLTDFGIAHDAAESRMTATGAAVGSLPYMAPEQIQHNKVDPRSDIYSLGITLYELLTGKLPFQAESGFAIMSAHVMQLPRPPLELNPQIDESLSSVILRSLAKNPDDRFQTAQEFRTALATSSSAVTAIAPAATITVARIPSASEVAVAPVAAKRSGGKWVAIVAGVVAVIAGTFVLLPRRAAEVAVTPAAKEAPLAEATPAPPVAVPEAKPPKKAEAKKEDPVPAVDPAAKEWQKLSTSRDVAALAAFRSRYPDSEFAKPAFQRVQEVQWENAKASADPARLRAYVESHPKSPFSPLATAEAERLEHAAQSKAVLDVLTKAAAAYMARDMDTLKEHWPALPPPRQQRIQATFRNSKSIEMKLDPTGEAQFVGDSAMVPVRHQLKLANANGETISLDEEITLSLRKSGATWVIVSFPINREMPAMKKKRKGN